MSRVGTIAHEHLEIRAAVREAEVALADLEGRGGRVVVMPASQGERSYSSQDSSSGPRTRTYFTGSLRMAWDGFVDALQSHIDHEELVLPELVRRVESGQADAAEVSDALRPLFMEHERLHELLGELRRASRGLEPVRPAMDTVISNFLRHSEEEDTRVFPVLIRHMGIEVEDLPVFHRYSADADISRSLRSSLRQPSADQAPSFFQRVLGLFAKE